MSNYCKYVIFIKEKMMYKVNKKIFYILILNLLGNTISILCSNKPSIQENIASRTRVLAADTDDLETLLDAQLKSFRDQLASAQQAQTTATSQAADARKAVEAAAADKKTNDARIKELQDQIARLTAQLNDARANASQQADAAKAAATQVAEARKAADGDKKASDARIKELQDQITRLTAQLADAQAKGTQQADAAKAAATQAAEAKRASDAQIKELQGKLAEIQAKQKELEDIGFGDIDAVIKKIKALKAKLKASVQG